VVRDEGDFPDSLVDDEEWETYYDHMQLNEHVRDRHVWSPREGDFETRRLIIQSAANQGFEQAENPVHFGAKQKQMLFPFLSWV
jgi:hypothetical protein